MKINLCFIIFLVGVLVLFTGCTKNPVADKVFCVDHEGGTLFFNFLSNGRLVSGSYYPSYTTDNKPSYVWECNDLDTASYYIKEGQVLVCKSGKHFGRASVENGRLNFRFFVDDKLWDMTLKEEKCFKKLQKTNQYAGTAYSCSTYDEHEVELLFVSDNIVILRTESKDNDEICSYQVTDDGYVGIKGKFELMPVKGNLQIGALGYTYMFRKTDYKPTEFDIVKTALITREREYKERKETLELLKKYHSYE